jgi:nucleoside-diphosphate-sugar epimerase
MRVLVTGGAGFIGSHLVARLVRRGDQVTVLTKPSSDLSRLDAVRSQVQHDVVDLKDRAALCRAVGALEPEGIFHLAASNIQSGTTASAEEVVASNVLGTFHLLEETLALPYRFLVQTGSFLEYGRQDRPLAEESRCEPRELYAVTKLAATRLGQAQANNHGKPVVTLRVFTPYGPALPTGRLVEQIITRALRGDEIPLTQPTVTRDLIHVTDAVELLLEAAERAIEAKGEVFNAGSGQATTLSTLVDQVLALTGSRSRVRWNAFPPVLYDAFVNQADMTKTLAHFAWRPKHTLESGLQQTIDWYRAA